MTLFNGTYLRKFPLKIRKIAPIFTKKNCTYHEKTTTITIGYLKKTQDGLQILAVRGFRNQSGRNFSRRDFKMPAFLFLRTFPRHHKANHL